MIRRPPRSTRTDTLVPYTTLFRSGVRQMVVELEARRFFQVLSASCVRIRHYAWGFIRMSLFPTTRSEEHTSELQSLMRISYAVFCLKKNKTTTIATTK